MTDTTAEEVQADDLTTKELLIWEDLDSEERKIKSVISARNKEIGSLYARLHEIRDLKRMVRRRATTQK